MSLLMTRQELEALEEHERKLMSTPGSQLIGPYGKLYGEKRIRRDADMCAKITDALKANPKATLKQIARATGIHLAHVIRLTKDCKRAMGITPRELGART